MCLTERSRSSGDGGRAGGGVFREPGIMETLRPASSCGNKSTDQMPGPVSSEGSTDEDRRAKEAWGADVSRVAAGPLLAPVQAHLHRNSLCKFPATPIQIAGLSEAWPPLMFACWKYEGVKACFPLRVLLHRLLGL